jgi:hypothetical protein
MYEGNDANPLPAHSIYNTVIPHDQLTYGFVCILGDNTPQLRMASKLLDSQDNASSHRHGICCRVSFDVLNDLP